jgi:hypothetical protein
MEVEEGGTVRNLTLFCPEKKEKGLAFYVNTSYTEKTRWGKVGKNPLKDHLSGGR